MKAIVVRTFGDPDVLRLEDVPAPEPGPGQVVVRNRAIGVNPVETYVRSGTYTRLPELPYTPGTDCAGDVEKVGAGVDSVRPGQRVYVYGTMTGAYAELTLAEQWRVHPLPERASYEDGAAVGVPAGAAWRALFVRGAARAGETVLVHGASGSVGMAAVQLARAAGLIVIGTAGSEPSRRRVVDAGAHHVVGHGDWDAVRKLTGGEGPPLILEMLANKNLPADVANLPMHGRVVVIGSRGPVEFDPRSTIAPERDVRGMSLPSATRQEEIGMHHALVAALAAGVLRPAIGEVLPLAEAARAHEAVMSGEAEGKIILRP